MAILVLQPFPGERGTAGSGAQQKAARAHVAGSPDKVTDTLKTEH